MDKPTTPLTLDRERLVRLQQAQLEATIGGEVLAGSNQVDVTNTGIVDTDDGGGDDGGGSGTCCSKSC